MNFLRQNPILLCVVVLLFAAGHAHQVFGRFVAHHHDAEITANYEDGERQHKADKGKKDAEHVLEHSAVVAVMAALICPMIITLHPVALVDTSAVQMSDAPVAGIDHPPQLIG